MQLQFNSYQVCNFNGDVLTFMYPCKLLTWDLNDWMKERLFKVWVS